MNIEQLYHDLIAKKLSKNATADEQKQLATWLKKDAEHQQIYEDTKELWELSKGYKDTPLAVNTAAAWEKIDGQIGTEHATSNQVSSGRVIKMRTWQRAMSIAATVALLVACWFYFQNTTSSDLPIAGGEQTENPANIKVEDMMVETTSAEEQKELTLPDGSKVWLNANSALSYPIAFADRKVTLEGEAFFDVKRDEKHPFEIYAGGAKTTVLGTSFNVRAYSNEAETEVTVRTGKVAVEALVKKETTNSILLTAGLSGVYKKEKATIEQLEVPVNNALAWQNKQLNFEETPMPDVVIALERYFNIDIELSNNALQNCDFDGDFDAPNLEEIWEVLQFSLDIEIDESNGVYKLKGDGC